MHLRSTLATALSIGALTTASLTATAGASSAEPVRPMGGCTGGVICGVVSNNTTHSVKVCKAWGASGTDGTYQATDACNDVAYVSPHTVYGGFGTDIDAIYIPSGTTYYGDLNGSIPMSWSHIASGWWKFGNGTRVDILYTG